MSQSRNVSTCSRIATALLVMLGILLAPRAVAAHATSGNKPYGGRTLVWRGAQRSCAPLHERNVSEGAALRTSPPSRAKPTPKGGDKLATPADKLATPANESVAPANESVTPANESVAPANESVAPANESVTITVVDDHNTRVVLHGYPRRIISLAPNVTEILYALGLGNRVVGVSQDSDYPAAVKSKPVVLTTSGANLEKIVALHPDVLIGAGIDSSYLPKLHTLRLPMIILDPHSISGVLHDITLVGTATGTARAQSLVASLRARILAVAQRLRHAVGHPRVLYELGADKAGVYTYGRGTFGDDLITRAGGINVGRTGKTAYPELNPEQIIAARPQVIVLGDAAYGTSVASVRARPGYSVLPAVRLGHIYPFNDDLVSRPGPRIVEGLEKMARLLHPEAFR